MKDYNQYRNHILRVEKKNLEKILKIPNFEE